MDQILTYILSAVGILGFYLAGKKVWWAWYVNIANQALWLFFSIFTQQWGFLLATFFYLVVFIKNAIAWTKDHRLLSKNPIKFVETRTDGPPSIKVNAKTTVDFMRKGSVSDSKNETDVDQELIEQYMTVGDTDPAVANEIAFVVTDVMRAHGKEWTQLSERYGIAHEVQRRLDVKLKGSRPDDKARIIAAIYLIDNATNKAMLDPNSSYGATANRVSIVSPMSQMVDALNNAKGTLKHLLKGV